MGSRRQSPDGLEAVIPWLKTEASVSCPTEALFFAAPKAFGATTDFQAGLAAKVPLRPHLTGTVSAAFFAAKASTKFSEIS